MKTPKAQSALFVLVLSALGLPLACFYPDYAFDQLEAAGAGGGSTATTSSSGGGASTTSTGPSTSSGGGGGGMPAPESDCLDDIDNDDDGDIDCADTDCNEGYACVEQAPTGWGTLGYMALYRGSPNTAPPCPSELPTTAYAGNEQPEFGDANCSACSCGAPLNQACELKGDLDNNKAGNQPMQVSNQPCGQAATNLISLTVPDGWGGVCLHNEQLDGNQTCGGLSCNKSVQSLTPTVSGGNCNPGGGVANPAPPSWKFDAKACKAATTGGGCSAGKVCAPRPPAPFEGGVCIAKAGEETCPGGSYQLAYTFYEDYDDTRDCTDCTCGSAVGGTCELTVSLYSDAGFGVCLTEVGKFKAGICHDIVGNPDIFGWTSAITGTPAGGNCPASTVSATGTVTPTTPTTFCCVPP